MVPAGRLTLSRSFHILCRRADLPEPKALRKPIAAAKFPLAIDTGWTWRNVGGWVPMRWRDEEAGCEVEFETLASKDAAAAAKAGFPGLDTAIVVTSRGWRSMQSACAFAAIVVRVAGGCIDEGEDAVVDPAAALRWARKAIAGGDQAIARQAQEAAAKAAAGGDRPTLLRQALAQFVDAGAAQATIFGDALGLRLGDGKRISASAWRLLQGDGRVLDVSRYATLRGRQVALLHDPQRRKDVDALEKQLDSAGALDEKDLAAALQVLAGWNGDIAITATRWQPTDGVRVSLGNGHAFEFVDAFSGINIAAPPLRFVVRGGQVDLL